METLQPGKRIDGYVIQRKIGTGGMGLVFEAIEERTGRKVALKISRFEGEGSESREKALQREMKALSRLMHPNITTLYRAGYFEQRFTFLAVEYVEGKNLRQFIREKRLGEKEILDLFLQLVEAVAYIQSKGIQHLDLKPSNVLVNEEGKVKLLDFGLSKLQHMGLDGDIQVLGDGEDPHQRVTGTFPYLAPEQLEGVVQDLGTETDVYQLGFILYELLLGQRPIEYLEGGRREMVQKIRDGSFLPPRRLKRTFSRDLEAIILKCMSLDPKDRYTGAAVLLQDLRAYLDGYPVQALSPSLGDFLGKYILRNRRKVLFWASLVLVSLVLGGFSFLSMVGERRAKERADGLERSLQITADAIENLGPGGRNGRAKVMAGVLRGVSEALNKEVGKGEIQPEQEARLRAMLGRHYTKIGMHKKALPQLERALQLRRALFGGRPHVELAQSLRDLAFLHHAMGHFAQSEPLHREALSMRLALFPEASGPVCQSKEELAELLIARGRPAEAQGLLRDRLFQIEQSPGGGVYFLRLLRDLLQLSLGQGKFEEVPDLLQRGQAYLDHNPQEVPAKERYRFLRIKAKALAMIGKKQESLVLLERLEPFCKSVFGDQSEEMVQLLAMEGALADFFPEGKVPLEKTKLAVELGTKLYGKRHAMTLAFRQTLCRNLIANGFKAEGKRELLELLRDYRESDCVGNVDQMRFILRASWCLMGIGEDARAESLLKEIRPFFLQEGAVDLSSRIFFHEAQARLLFRKRKYRAVLEEAQRGLALVGRTESPRLGLWLMGQKSVAYKYLGKPELAKKVLEEARQLCKKLGRSPLSTDTWERDW